MSTTKTVPFSANGKTYEIRIDRSIEEVKVQSFLEGKPANPFTYSVSMDTDFDHKTTIGTSAIDELIKLAKSDILEQRGTGTESGS